MEGTFLARIDDDGIVRFKFRPQFDAFAKHLIGEEVEIIVRKFRSKRSSAQNRAFHACMAEWAAWLQRDTGTPVDVEQLKDDLLAVCWGYVVRQSLLTGEVVKELVKPHTSRLNTAEFAELFDQAVIEAAKSGYVMELPDEFKERKARDAKRRRAA